MTSVMFSPKNDRIVTTSTDKTCNFYDLVANKITITLRFFKEVLFKKIRV